MSRTVSNVVAQFSAPLVVVLVLALWYVTRTEWAQQLELTPHPPHAHGGVMVPLAAGRYHVEAIVDNQGLLRLFVLGADASRTIDVPRQPLTAFLMLEGEEAVAIELQAESQPGGRPETTSQFVGQLPASHRGLPIDVSIPNLRIDRERFRVAFAWNQSSHRLAMGEKVGGDAERTLYLTAGGKYTVSDIVANGRQVPSQVFVAFLARHDFNPQPGDAICPITRTKANEACGWIIDGQRYQFCCPPCIDEFVALAKQEPAALKPSDKYVQTFSSE